MACSAWFLLHLRTIYAQEWHCPQWEGLTQINKLINKIQMLIGKFYGRHFLIWGSLFPDGSSLCRVDKELTSAEDNITWYSDWMAIDITILMSPHCPTALSQSPRLQMWLFTLSCQLTRMRSARELGMGEWAGQHRLCWQDRLPQSSTGVCQERQICPVAPCRILQHQLGAISSHS